MDLAYSEEEIRFRAEVRAVLLSAVPSALRRKVMEERPLTRDEVVQSQRILNAVGYAVPHWPVEWGGKAWSPVKRAILAEEIERNAVPNPLPFNVALVGPVIAAFGTEAQKTRFLPAVANLDLWFCQGFSEPGAGSDLAALSTRAIRDGEVYRVTGQKLWTTFAHHADWMFALVRTDPDAKKQQGISFLLIDMRSPGITVRPITTIDGHHEVNEVFLDDVRVPAENLVGEENKGWDYAKYLLAHERVSIAHLGLSRRRLDRVRATAEETRVGDGVLWDDPHFRRRVWRAEIALKALEITQLRVVADRGDAGGPDPKTSILKVKGSELQQLGTELMLDAIGPEAGLADGGAPDDDDWRTGVASAYFGNRRVSIFGGSNEIQRSIIARGILGL